MPDYKKILVGYINDSKNGDGKYLAISNVSDEDIIIKAGDKLFLNMTPKDVREKHPKVPLFSKSVKVEDEFSQHEDISDDIPF